MNEKLNNKPIEMPARGRPRKKETGLEYGSDYESQKPLYGRHNFSQFVNNEPNALFDYMEASSEKEINNMYPYKSEQRTYDMFQGQTQQFMGQNMRQDETRIDKKHEGFESDFMRNNPTSYKDKNKDTISDIMLEEFNKIGDSFFSNQSTSQGESFQVTPKDIQNSRSGGRYSSTLSEDKINSSSEVDSMQPQGGPRPPPFGLLGTSHEMFGMDMTNSFGSNLDEMRVDERKQPHFHYTKDSEYSNTFNSSNNSPENHSSSQNYHGEPLMDRFNRSDKNGGYENRNGLHNRQVYTDKQQKTHMNMQEGSKYLNYPQSHETMKRMNINTMQYPIEGYPPNRRHFQAPPSSNLYGHTQTSQQWYPNQTPMKSQGPPHYRNIPQLHDEPPFVFGSELPPSFMPPLYPDSINFLGSGPWYSRKKRKTNPLLWQYTRNSHDPNRAIMHPSKYSSLDYIQGNDNPKPPSMYPPHSKRVQSDRESNNTVLPLFLNSSKELTDEFRDVVNNFKQKIRELDFTNVTVQQLKIFMREFGLNHTGKKNELIDRLKNTLVRIENRCTGNKPPEDTKKPPAAKDDEYGYYFF